MQDFKTEHRISELMKALHMAGDDVRRVYYNEYKTPTQYRLDQEAYQNGLL